MATLAPFIKQRFFDSNGDPLVGGKLYSYAAGTSTPLNTYTDSTAATPNANPVILDANGEAEVWLSADLYKFVLADANDIVQFTVDNVSSDLITDGSIQTASLADGAVTEAKLATDSVTTAKIANLNVTTGKIADNAVTQEKRAALGQQISSSSGTFSGSSATAADVTNLTVTITTTGRPVFVGLVHDGTTNAGYVRIYNGSTTQATGTINILRASTVISSTRLELNKGASAESWVTYPVSSFFYIEAPAAGTYTYKVQYLSEGATATDDVRVYYAKLIAYEL